MRILPWNLYNHSASSIAWLVGLWSSTFLPLEGGSLREIFAIINAVLRIWIAILCDGGFLRYRRRSYVHSNCGFHWIFHTWDMNEHRASSIAWFVGLWSSILIPLEGGSLRELILISNTLRCVWKVVANLHVNNIRFWSWCNVHCYRHFHRLLTWNSDNNLAILRARILGIWCIFLTPIELSAFWVLILIGGTINYIFRLWQILTLRHVDLWSTWVNNGHLYWHVHRILTWNCYNNNSWLFVAFLRRVWLAVFLPLKGGSLRELILIGNAVFWLRLHALWHSHNFSRSSRSLNSYRYVDYGC